MTYQCFLAMGDQVQLGGVWYVATRPITIDAGEQWEAPELAAAGLVPYVEPPPLAVPWRRRAREWLRDRLCRALGCPERDA